jgi:NMD protein affecting ribosome stability and mRNA decay
MTGRPYQSTCRQCGAPRDPELSTALCRNCRNANQRAERAVKRLAVRRGAIAADTNHQRARNMREAYARLGLEAGAVWKRALE